MATRKIVSNLVGADVTTFIGTAGELFYDPATTILRFSDGVTSGGQVVVSSGASQSYVDTAVAGVNTTANTALTTANTALTTAQAAPSSSSVYNTSFLNALLFG